MRLIDGDQLIRKIEDLIEDGDENTFIQVKEIYGAIDECPEVIPSLF